MMSAWSSSKSLMSVVLSAWCTSLTIDALSAVCCLLSAGINKQTTARPGCDVGKKVPMETKDPATCLQHQGRLQRVDLI